MKICSFLIIALFVSSCASDSLPRLKEMESDQLSEFDHCVKNNANQLLSEEGTPGEVADFVMDACNTSYLQYKEAIFRYLKKKSPAATNDEDLEEKSDKVAQNMWDKIRAKVLKYVETKGKSSAGPPSQ